MPKISTISGTAILIALAASCASSAEISLEKFDVFDDRTHHLHIDGRIEQGDLERVAALTAALPQGRDEILAVSLNSPGGDAQVGLDIARHLQRLEMQVITDVMTRDGEPGSCASACSYIYLGGTYRYLSAGSRLGVHQFAYVHDGLSQRSQVARDVQIGAADITSLLSDAHVDPGFFSLMGATAPEDMNWVDPDTLERMNVLNRDRAYQDNDFTLSGGSMKLVMTHVGLFGVSRLTAECRGEDIVFESEIFLSDGFDGSMETDQSQMIGERFIFRVMADGYAARPDLASPQRYVDQAVITTFRLPPEQISTLLSARSIDARLVEESGIFVGARYDISDGKLGDLIGSCMDVAPMLPSSLGGSDDTEVTESPVLVAATLGAVRRGNQPQEAPDQAATPEELAVALYHEYLSAWSSVNEHALQFMEARYAERLDFYGKEISRGALMDEKRIFAERWPERRYSARQETMEVSCPDQYTCLVAAVVDWEAHSPARNKSASGVAWYGLGFDLETGQVLFEDGESRKR